MKKLILFAITISTITFAQSTINQVQAQNAPKVQSIAPTNKARTSAERAEEKIAMLSKHIKGLSAEQKQKLTNIYASHYDRLSTITSGDQPTKAMISQVTAERENRVSAMKAVFTAEQSTQYDAFLKELKNKKNNKNAKDEKED